LVRKERTVIDLLIVPTDFSDHAFAATRLAAAIARSHGAVLHLVHVDTLPGGATEGDPPVGVPAELWATYVRDRAASLDRLLAALAGPLADGVTVHRSVLMDETSTAILNQARSREAALVVMGSHSSASDRFLLGSVASAVAVRSPCPVLITRDDQTARLPEQGRFGAPLLALREPPSARSAAILADLLVPGVAVDLVPAWSEVVDEPRAVREDKLANMAATPPLDRFDTRLILPDLRLTAAMVARLQSGSNDLVVLGARAAEAPNRAGLGLLADHLLHRSPIPVLLLPDREE
jgi:nucleotide-binding universal stress UspA family protein